MATTIAVLSDVHHTPPEAPGRRSDYSDLADTLLLRAVHRINRTVRPDVTLLLGDFIEFGENTAAKEWLTRLSEITDLLESPTVAIPGNHDGAPEAFYSVFDRPPEVFEVNGVRILPFIDAQEPGFHATRSPHNLQRMAAARVDFDGPIVTAQHVSLFPPGSSDCPYNYTNAEDVIAAMDTHRITLAVSGHYHPGMETLQTDGLTFTANPSLCDPPFRFSEITLDPDDVRVRWHALRQD